MAASVPVWGGFIVALLALGVATLAMPENRITWILARIEWILRPLRLSRVGAALTRWIGAGRPLVIGFFLGVAFAGFLVGGVLLAGDLVVEQTQLEIRSLKEGEAVPLQNTVEVQAPRLEDAEFLAVVVRPNPDDPFNDYFVQGPPTQVDDHRWVAQRVFVGSPDDAPGLPFKICALITEMELVPGGRMHELPPGPVDCVRVVRE